MHTLCLFFALTLSAANAANVHYENKVFGLSVTGNGNVPKYEFWLQANATTRYNVQFNQFFEAIPQADGTLKKNGQSNIALASLDWEWTDIIDDGNGDMHFTITARDSGHGNTKQFSSFILQNHIKANVTLDCDNKTISAPLLKFDVLINDYTWVSAEPEAKVVLEFSFSSPGGHAEKVDGRVKLGDAYFTSASTASSYDDPDKTTSVVVTTDYNGTGGGIWLIYDHWTGAHLVHDPELGFGEPSGINTILIIVLSIIGVAVVGILIVLFVYRQRRHYQSV